MCGKVKRLRYQGRRLTDREIANASFVEDELTLFYVRTEPILTERSRNNQVGPSLYPEPHDARLVGMHNGKMALKGEERPQGDAGPAFVQEWSVLVAQY